MTVAWSKTALDDRERILQKAWQRARAGPDPQIFGAAEAQDGRIRVEGNPLDGDAVFRKGPIPDTYVYPTHGGLFLLLYRRDGDHVQIERIVPSRSNWQGATP